MAVEAVGCVILEGSGFLALFPRQGDPRDHGPLATPDCWPRVGLYATEPEAQRVVDLLRLKEALDSGLPLERVPLHLPLQEYMNNDSTMQYLRDHDMATVWATFHACGAEQLQPACDPYAGGGGGPVTYAPSGAVTTAPSGAVVGAGGALPAGMGRNWWEQLSDEEVAEAGGATAAAEAYDGYVSGAEGGWATDLGLSEDADLSAGGAASPAAHLGQQQAQQQPAQLQQEQREGREAQPRRPSPGGPADGGSGTREGTPSGRPRRAAALRNPNIPSMAAAAEAVAGGVAASADGSGSSRQHQLSTLAAHRQAEEEERRREQLAEAAAAAAATAAAAGEEMGGGPTPKKRSKTIIFPPVPSSMKCNQCVNCQNPQRKRPCVLARRRLLELLREQEEAAAAAEEAALEAAEAEAKAARQAPACSAGERTAAAAAGAVGTLPAAAPTASGAVDTAEPAGTPRSPAAAIRSALSLPSRKQLYPIIPPSERCGRCKPCLNPKLKKACREARQRQLEAGLAPPFQQMLYNQQKALAGGGAGGTPAPGGSPTPAAAAAAASAAGAAGRARVPPSVATAAAVAAGRQLGASLIGCRVRIYWPGMRRWYEGRISAYDAPGGQHHIEYDDGDQQDHVLGEEKYILLDPPRAQPPAGPVEQGADDGGTTAASGGGATPAKRPRSVEEPGDPAEQQAEQQRREVRPPPPLLQKVQRRGDSGASPGRAGRKGSGGACGTLGGSPATAPDTPAAAAAAPGGATPLLLRSTPMGPAAAAAAEAVVQLPAALAACCRRGSETAAAAAAAGVTAMLVGRFMAAFSCRMSTAQRQEHAAFLMPLLEAECYEGVQACLEEALVLCSKAPSPPVTTCGTMPAALPAAASQGDRQAGQQSEPATVVRPGSDAGAAPAGGIGASCSGSGSQTEAAMATVRQEA